MTPPAQRLAALVDRAADLARAPQRSLIAVVGPPGSGKSTLTARLLDELARRGLADSVRSAPMDGFHLSNAELRRLGRAERKGAIDTFDAAGYLHLLRRLAARDEAVVYAPEFDRRIEESIAGALAIPRDVALVICEGNYLLASTPPWDRMRPLFHAAWYCEVPDSVRLPRLIARHEQFGKAPEQARDWAAGPDQVNADIVVATRDRADLVYVEDVSDGALPTA